MEIDISGLRPRRVAYTQLKYMISVVHLLLTLGYITINLKPIP